MGKRVDFSARTVITGIPIAWGSPLDVLCCISNNYALECMSAGCGASKMRGSVDVGGWDIRRPEEKCERMCLAYTKSCIACPVS
jgi:hypothetical protein